MGAQAAYHRLLRASEEFGSALEAILPPGQEVIIDEGERGTVHICSPDVLRHKRVGFGMDNQASGFSVGMCLGVAEHYIMGGVVEVDGERRLLFNPAEAGHERGHCWQEIVLGTPEANRRMDTLLEGL